MYRRIRRMYQRIGMDVLVWNGRMGVHRISIEASLTTRPRH